MNNGTTNGEPNWTLLDVLGFLSWLAVSILLGLCVAYVLKGAGSDVISALGGGVMITGGMIFLGTTFGFKGRVKRKRDWKAALFDTCTLITGVEYLLLMNGKALIQIITGEPPGPPSEITPADRHGLMITVIVLSLPALIGSIVYGWSLMARYALGKTDLWWTKHPILHHIEGVFNALVLLSFIAMIVNVATGSPKKGDVVMNAERKALVLANHVKHRGEHEITIPHI